ncbi:MAG TPA: helix-turn-helix domain-containing protein [Vicinamibacterales bacterium]|nr:helix-turn-helix domain-containing protein [Vicinamibacterales bacterium]
MQESFGARLRRQRERKRIPLALIAEQTKIHQPLLDALERDDVSRWPTGIFRRAFIRSYAEAIGLEPDQTVREFLACYPDPIEVVSIGAALATVTSSKERPPTRLAEMADTMTESVLGFLRRIVGRDEVGAGEVRASAPPAAPEKPADPEPFDLARASRSLDAVGVIVWAWDPLINALRPSMSYGYSSRVLAQLPNVGRDADNATAAAFRSGKTCAVAGVNGATGALAAPIVSEDGCVGVLAVELPGGAEKSAATREAVAAVAAQIGPLVELRRPSQEDRYERSVRRRA